MNSTRPFLFFAVLLTGFFLWQAWQQDYASKPAVQAPSAAATATAVAPPAGEEVPVANSAVPAAPPAPGAAPAAAETAASQRIEITTDLLHAAIDTRGGSLVEADLLAYPVEPDD